MTDHELERALRALYRSDIDDRDGAPAQLRAELPALLAAGAGTQPGLVGGWTAPTVLRFAPLALAATAVVLMAFVGIGLLMRPNTGIPPAPSTGPSGPPPATREWTGPVRTGPMAEVIAMDRDGSEGWSLVDENDASRPYVDVDEVQAQIDGQNYYRIMLSDAPPRAAGLDPTRTVISYGVTFDTNRDGIADYVVGISNEAPQAGDFRVWVTDLATGDTEEQIGPPYGYPVEFSHPDDRTGEEPNDPGMVFTFLSGTIPPGLNDSSTFFAWASVEEDGRVVAWDYAPDLGWMVPDAPAASPTEGERVYGWPGTSRNGPGLFSWDGATCHMNAGGDCTIGFMHNGYGSGDVKITIGVAGGSISATGGTPVTVAGHEGTYRRVDERLEEWLVDIQGTTYYIRLSAERGTSEADLAEAHAIIDSMRTEPRDNDLGFRLVFRLTTADWDSG